jgi:integrase/recombinase XerC
MTNDELFARHALSQERRGLQKSSIKIRDQYLRTLAAAHPRRKTILTVTREEIEAFLDGRGIDVSTRKAWLSHLNSFYRWAVGEGYGKANPVEHIIRPKVPRRLPRPADPDELDAALKAADPKMKAWILLAGMAGLRCMEIATLQGQDINWASKTITVRGKGDKERTVAVNARTLQSLKRLKPPRRGPVFTRPMGGGYSNSGLSDEFNRFLRGAGVHATAHQLRHFYGTEMFRKGHDVLVVQQQMGHASPVTTAGYVAADPAAAAKLVSQLKFSQPRRK